MTDFHLPLRQESETLEFKESLNEKEAAGESLVAFANKNGGVVYFGLKDNGEIKGLQGVSEKTLRELAQLYGDNTEPKLYPKITTGTCEGKQIIKIEIAQSSTPYHIFRGSPYIRVGSSNRKMTQADYRERLMTHGNNNFDFSAEACVGLSFKDLDTSAIEILRKKWSEKEQKEEYLKFSLQAVLEKLLLIRDEKITFAALLLCGKPEKIAEFLPEAEIRFGWKNDPKKLDFDFTKDWREPFLKIDDDIWATINARNSRFPFDEGFIEGDIWAFDQKSIREAVLNAVAHRDYREKGSIFLKASPVSFIVKSPGKFLPGVSPENALDSEGKWRNRLLMETLGKIGLVERYGHGLDRIFKESISKGKGTPQLHELKTGFVALEIPAQVKDEKFIIFLNRVANEKQIRFDLAKDLIFLDEIRERQTSFDKVRRDQFMQLDIIEKAGKGRGTKYFLSRKFYDFLNQKGEYTRKKWLAKDQQKEVLWKFFQQYKQGRMVDFREGLFEGRLTNQQINILLGELRNENKIYFDGPKKSKSAPWRLTIKDTKI
jgi:ATP-dependent DNA helicase RecG